MYNDISISDSIAERLKDLRENWEDENGKIKKLSHRELADRINTKFGASLHPDTLKFYEAKSGHSKAGNNMGMKLETLLFLADFYQVSTDYILGRDPYPLSDRARANISRICTTPYKDILNELLASAKLQDILNSLAASRLTVRKRIKEILESESISETRLGELKTEMRHLKRDNADDMAGALRFICNYNKLESAIKIKREQNRSREEAANGEHTED